MPTMVITIIVMKLRMARRSAVANPSRVLVWAVLAVTAVIAIGAQLDRATLGDTRYAKWVPSPFRRIAEANIVADALASGGESTGPVAFGHAVTLVQRRPIPAENLVLLALSAANVQNNTLSDEALTLAASRGWREPFSQSAMARQAIQVGAWAVAFDRTIALWSTDKRNDFTTHALDSIIAHPDGRAEAVRWMLDSPRWRSGFSNWAAVHLDAMAVTQVLDSLQRRDQTALSCRDLANVSRAILLRGSGLGAQAIWTGACAKDQQADDDFRFTEADGTRDSSPYSWRYSSIAKVSERRNGTSEVSYHSRDPGVQDLATRITALMPGYYTVSLVFTPGAERTGLSPILRFGCISAGGVRRTEVRTPLDTQRTLFVPVRGCDVQVVSLGARRGSGSIASFKLTRNGA